MITGERTCVSHKCLVCRRTLYTISWRQNLALLGTTIFVGAFLVFLAIIFEGTRDTGCFVREYKQETNGTAREIILIKSIDCDQYYDE